MSEKIPQLLPIPQALIKKFIDSGVIILQLKTEPDDPLITGYDFMPKLVTSFIDMQFLAKAFISTILCNSIKFNMLFSSSYKGYQLLNTICESSDMICSLYAGNIKSRLPDTDAISGDIVKGNVLIVESDIDSLEKSIKYIKDKGGLPIAAIVSYAQGSLQQLQSKYNIPIFAVATTDDLLKYLDYVNKKEEVSTEKPVLSIEERVEKIKDLKEKFMQYCLDKDIIIFTDEGYLILKGILSRNDSFISNTIYEMIELLGIEHNRIYGNFCKFDTLFTESDKVLIIDEDIRDMVGSIKTVREKSGVYPIATLVLFGDIDDIDMFKLTGISPQSLLAHSSYCILNKADILRESKCIKASIKNTGYSSTLNLHDIWLKEGNNPLIDNEPLTHKLHEKFHKINEEFHELLDTSNNTEVFTNRIMGPFKCLVMTHNKPFIVDYDFNLAYPTMLNFKTCGEVPGRTISFNEDNSQPIHKTLEGLTTVTSDNDMSSSDYRNNLINSGSEIKSFNHENVELMYKEDMRFKLVVDVIKQHFPYITKEQVWKLMFCESVSSEEVPVEIQSFVKGIVDAINVYMNNLSKDIKEGKDAKPFSIKFTNTESDQKETEADSDKIAEDRFIKILSDNTYRTFGLSPETVSTGIISPGFIKTIIAVNNDICDSLSRSIKEMARVTSEESSIKNNLCFETRYGDKLHVIDVLRNRVDEINNKINKLWKKSEFNPTEKNNLKTIKLTNELDCILFLINKLTKE